jgi:SAM-dependent methyltransferase
MGMKAREEKAMVERELADRKARTFFEDLWQRGDFWEFESSDYEQARFAHLLKMLDGRRYGRVFEIGCGAGYFTRLLARIADQVVALDISPSAIARARALGIGPGVVDFRVANIMDYQWRADCPWDLVVMTDTICYLGWLYPFFDIAWLAAELFKATRHGGSFLLANSMSEDGDALLLSWYIRTYRDLFLNVGYQLAAEEIFQGTKNGVAFEILISLLAKPLEKDTTEEIAEFLVRACGG